MMVSTPPQVVARDVGTEEVIENTGDDVDDVVSTIKRRMSKCARWRGETP